MRGLRVLDLFSGIGGFSLGLERTGDFETDAHTNPSSPHCGKGVAAGPAVSEGDRGHGAPVTSGAEVARAGVIDECLAAIDALKDFVPANPQGRVRFSIYDLTRAFRAGISMAREDIAALVSGSREDGADAP